MNLKRSMQLVMALCVTMGLVASPTSTRAQEPVGAVAGTLRDVTGVPIENMGVWLSGITDPSVFRTTASDASGYYEFNDLAAGDYHLMTVDYRYGDENGYATAYYGGVQDPALSPAVTVTAGQTTTSIDFVLEHWGVISGLVLDKQGTPIPNVHLRALAAATPYGEYYGTTQADGTYRLVAAAGNYRVVVLAMDTPEYAQTYFNNTYSRPAAQVISVAPGETTPGIDFALEAAASISGTVLNSIGDVVPDSYVNAFNPDIPELSIAVQVGQDGSYRIAGLPPGDYRVQVMTNTPGYPDVFYDGALTYMQAAVLTAVPGVEIADVNFVLQEIPPATNDDFDSALLIGALPFTDVQEALWATTAYDDPAVPCDGMGTGMGSLWYKYVATADGLVRVDTIGSSDQDFLGVWTGQRGSLSSMGCISGFNSSATDVFVPVLSGQTYYIEIGPMWGPYGTMTLNVDYAESMPFGSCANVTQIPVAECNALSELYQSTNGDNWTNHANWFVVDTPCDWLGITCTDGHVTAFVMESNGLSGTLPTDAWAGLPYLMYLDVYDGTITGTIPTALGSLTNLKALFLDLNQLDGTIPASLGNLTGLEQLGLSDNLLEGSIPSELGQLLQLKNLYLGGNQLTGGIPPEFGNLPLLRRLHLGRNQLSGPIPPELGNLTNLQTLHLRDNLLTGSVPAELGNLTALYGLRLDTNELSGEIPLSITNLSGLSNLTLSCGLTSTNPAVIEFLDARVPGWQAAQCLNTQPGTDVLITPEPGTSIAFAEVTSAGYTTVQEASYPIAAPPNFQILGNAYEITSGSTFSQAQVCFEYDDAGLTLAQEAAVRLLHLENDAWTDVTDEGYPDTASNQVCGTVGSFSPFVVAFPDVLSTFAEFWNMVEGPGDGSKETDLYGILVLVDMGGDFPLPAADDISLTVGGTEIPVGNISTLDRGESTRIRMGFRTTGPQPLGLYEITIIDSSGIEIGPLPLGTLEDYPRDAPDLLSPPDLGDWLTGDQSTLTWSPFTPIYAGQVLSPLQYAVMVELPNEESYEAWPIPPTQTSLEYENSLWDPEQPPYGGPGRYFLDIQSSAAAAPGMWITNDRFYDLTVPANTAPSDVVINGPVDPKSTGSTVPFSATFTDPDAGDVHQAVWQWGDSSTSTIEGYVSGAATSHVYTSPGVYTVTVTISDATGESATATFQFVVVYDPDGGFVTGGGWIDSPVGAYAANPSLTGRATFGFVSKYLKGANVPSGNTEFQFKVADFSFKSTSYDWLVVAGAKAQFKGSGTINGAGDYWFMLTVTDSQMNGGGEVDRFRMKIWDKATGGVIYDNQMDASNDALPTTALQGGSIVVHK